MSVQRVICSIVYKSSPYGCGEYHNKFIVKTMTYVPKLINNDLRSDDYRRKDCCFLLTYKISTKQSSKNINKKYRLLLPVSFLENVHLVCMLKPSPICKNRDCEEKVHFM